MLESSHMINHLIMKESISYLTLKTGYTHYSLYLVSSILQLHMHYD